MPQTRWAGDYCELDIDECEGGLHNCDQDDRAECDNSEGSFVCNCRQYWEGDGYSPETSTADWACTATNGCLWHAGYVGCSDIDDCGRQDVRGRDRLHRLVAVPERRHLHQRRARHRPATSATASRAGAATTAGST